MEIQNLKIYLWSDSKDVLYWLHGLPSRWPVFVRNRCIRIHKLVPKAEWLYVRSADNPADSASRGMMPSCLENFSLWWEGPPWLKKPDVDYAKSRVQVNSTLNPESEKLVHCVSKVRRVKLSFNLIYDIIERYSHFNGVVGVVVYLMRLQDKVVIKMNEREGKLPGYT